MPAIGTVVSLATATAEAVAALDAAVLYTRAVAEMHRPARGRRGTRPVRPAGVGPADVLALRGNLAELHHTVVLLARCAKGGIVELDSLPEELRTPRRALGMLESAEREAWPTPCERPAATALARLKRSASDATPSVRRGVALQPHAFGSPGRRDPCSHGAGSGSFSQLHLRADLRRRAIERLAQDSPRFVWPMRVTCRPQWTAGDARRFLAW